MTREQIKVAWDWIQSLLDIDGDVWMGLFTAIILLRLLLILKGYPGLTTTEGYVYSVALGSFAYSNKGNTKQ